MAKPFIVSGDFTGTVQEDDAAKAAATGTIQAQDDDGAVTYSTTSGAGKFGAFAIDAVTGAWRYDLDNEAAQPLDNDGTPANPTEVFKVQITGGGTKSDSIVTEVRIDVNGENDAPVAADDAFATSEDRPLVVSSSGVLGNDTDADGDNLAAELVAGPTNGTLQLNTNGSFTYTPEADFNGSDSFTYRASDGTGTSDAATVTIDVTSVSDAPVVSSDSATVSEDETKAIGGTLAIVDGDGDPVTVTSQGAKYGAFAIADDGKWTYDLDQDSAVVQALPAGGKLIDAITVAATDDSGKTGTGTLSITIEGANDDPIAVDDNAAANEDAAISILALANDSDPDTGDKISITGVEVVGGKGVAGTDGTRITFDPSGQFEELAVGETAPVVVRYQISDGKGGVDEAVVNVDVQGRNDLPVAVGESVLVAEDQPITIDVLANDTDIDGDTLSIDSVGSSKNGTVQIVDNEIVFTPTANFNGSTSFTYVASDGTGKSNIATVDVEVTPVNDAPVTVADKATTDEDKPVTVAVLANDSDVDRDALQITDAVVDEGKGSASTSDGQSLTYFPDASYDALAAGQTEVVKITYTATDAAGASTPGTLEVTVRGVNDAPTAVDDAAATNADAAVSIDALANDTDPDATDVLSLSSAKITSGLGKVTIQDGQLAYAPGDAYESLGEGETTDVVISYNISDGNKGTATANAVVTVTGVNDAPTAVADKATTDENTIVSIAALANDKDPDTSDTLTITAVALDPDLGGSVTTDGESVVFDPLDDFDSLGAKQSANVGISYTISDGKGGDASSTIQLTVKGVNDAPVAADDAAETTENAAVSIAVVGNDTDIDSGDKLSVKSVQVLEGNGTAKASGGSITYAPVAAYDSLAAGEEATVKLGYVVTDSGKATDDGEVTITVIGENDAPKAVADKTTTAEDTAVTIDVLANDTDIDASDKLSITGNFVNVIGGAVSVVDGGVLFTPTADYNGKGGFTYEISDGQGGTSSAAVSVDITSVNDAPVAGPAAFGVDEDKTVKLDLLSFASDIDAGDKLLVVGVDTAGTLGTVTLNNKGVTYAADASAFDFLADGDTATDTFTYTVADKAGATSTATVTMTITGIEDTSVFLGTEGADNFKGTPGEDFISGFGGNDTLAGADGADSIDGGEGNDRLSGGNGIDRFALSQGNDVITDFVKGIGGDILDVTALGTTQANLDDFLQFVKVGGNTEIFFDQSGNGQFGSPDATTTVQNADLVGDAGSQQAVIDKLVADGNLFV